MENLVELSRPRSSASSQAEKLREKYGADAVWLGACAKWRAARFQQMKVWAEHDLEWGWGTIEDRGIRCDTSSLDEMLELQSHFGDIEPKTVLLARELLNVCITVLAHAEEKHGQEDILSDGPVIEILRNVSRSLDWLEPETPLTLKAARMRQKRRKT